VRTKVRELLDRLAQHDSVDFARDLAYPLPAALIFGWLGFPHADHAQLRRWHLAMLQRTPGVAQLPARAVQARDAMWGHIEQALDDRHARRRDDLLSALAGAEADGALSRGEAMANALFFLDAGIVSTSALISSALLHLQRRPAQRELLRRSAQIIPAAVEELLRFDAPFQWFTRVTTRAVDVRGRRIEAGERVVLIWASANRDERRWEHADELLLTRDPQRHLSFSEGIHHCLGSHLARMEARILLEELMPRLVDYDIAGPVRRRITPSERTISSLPVHVRWSRGG
jgi:cytochrome P450